MDNNRVQLTAPYLFLSECGTKKIADGKAPSAICSIGDFLFPNIFVIQGYIGIIHIK